MKKAFLVLAVAGFLVSCDNAGDAEQRTKDSLDSVQKATANKIDSNANNMKDSLDNKIDAQKNMVDSLNKDTTKP